jgi:hypothetical protein
MAPVMTPTRTHSANRRNDEIAAADSTTELRDESAAGVVPDGKAGDFIDETIAIWQKRTRRRLTREDGREIIENMTGFFRILQEWDRAERSGKNRSSQLSAEGTSSIQSDNF